MGWRLLVKQGKKNYPVLVWPFGAGLTLNNEFDK